MLLVPRFGERVFKRWPCVDSGGRALASLGWWLVELLLRAPVGSAEGLVLWLVVRWRPLPVAPMLVAVARWPLVLWLVLLVVLVLLLVVVVVVVAWLLLLRWRRLRVVLGGRGGSGLVLHHGLQVAVVLRVPAAVEVALLLLWRLCRGTLLVAGPVTPRGGPRAACCPPVVVRLR